LLNSTIVRSFITVGIFNYSQSVVSLVSSIVLSRFLLPEEYGVIALVIVFTGFFTFFNDTGYSHIIIREKLINIEEYNFDILTIFNGFLVSILIIISSYPISWFYDDNSLITPVFLLALINFIQVLSVYPIARLKRDLKFNKVGQATLISAIIGTLSAVFFAYLDFSFYSILIGQLTTNIILVFLVRSKFPFPRINGFLKALKFSRKTILNISGNRIASYWNQQQDRLIVGKYFSTFDIGIYNRSFQLMQIQNTLVAGVVNTAFLPLLKHLDDDRKQNHIFISLTSLITVFQLPIILFMIFYPLTISRLLWGLNWDNVSVLIPYVAIISVFYLPLNINSSMFLIRHKEDVLLRLNIISFPIILIALLSAIGSNIENLIFNYSLVYIGLVVPLFLFFGYYKTIKIRNFSFFISWSLKILFSLFMIISLIIKHTPLLIFSSSMLFMETLFFFIYNKDFLLIKLILKNAKEKN